MASGGGSEPSAVRRMLQSLAQRMSSKNVETTQDGMDRVARLGMSRRQQELNHLWSWYCSERYSARKFDWAGHENLDHIDREAIATQGTLPAGFVDAGSMMPMKFRRPSLTYALARVVVNRFTGLLFSERMHPQLRELSDADTDGFISAMIEESRLWPKMILARTYGGAMGSVAISFKFVNGSPVVEVHDPRWIQPTFADRESLKLSSIEKRYMYVQEERDERGVFVSVWYWYRRVIDESRDVLYAPAAVADGDEPEWIESEVVDHNLGFCPAVWIQNTPVQDAIDGEPDCQGIYDEIEGMDQIFSQSHKSFMANLDPTVVISTDAKMDEIRKGSDNAIKLPTGGTANYMEIAGGGATQSLEFALKLRDLALEVAQCVLEHGSTGEKTAFEIERVYSSMYERADIMREQYGQHGVRALVGMMIDAARKLGAGAVNAEGQIEKQVVILPPKITKAPDGTTKTEMHKLGKGQYLSLKWPRYVQPTMQDVQTATTAAVAAKTGGLIDTPHAVSFVAELFRVEDPQEMVGRIEQEQQKRQASGADDMLARMRGMV